MCSPTTLPDHVITTRTRLLRWVSGLKRSLGTRGERTPSTDGSVKLGRASIELNIIGPDGLYLSLIAQAFSMPWSVVRQGDEPMCTLCFRVVDVDWESFPERRSGGAGTVGSVALSFCPTDQTDMEDLLAALHSTSRSTSSKHR